MSICGYITNLSVFTAVLKMVVFLQLIGPPCLYWVLSFGQVSLTINPLIKEAGLMFHLFAFINLK